MADVVCRECERRGILEHGRCVNCRIVKPRMAAQPPVDPAEEAYEAAMVREYEMYGRYAR